ncbi:MAG: hypothetical protein PHP55_02305 [Methanoculleus sp.]|jgi:predicted Fe-Mo cluster-binding NifX family protein|nr:hypothetical protein [Methanoculleus sp.]
MLPGRLAILTDGDAQTFNDQCDARCKGRIPEEGGQVAEMLLAHEIDVILVRHSLSGRAAGYALEAAGVEMRMTSAATLAEVIGHVVGRHGIKVRVTR